MKDLSNPTNKYKQYYVSKIQVTLFEAWAEDKDSALDMVKNKTSGGLAGLPTQKGYNTLIMAPLVDYKVSEEVPPSSPTDVKE